MEKKEMENFLTWVGMCWEGKLMRDVLAMNGAWLGSKRQERKGRMEIFQAYVAFKWGDEPIRCEYI